MRIISQDGFCDVLYDLIVVTHSGISGQVYAKSALNGDFQCMLAQYSCEQKALKAMEMLREAYAGKPILNVDELPNLTPQDFREKLGTGDILLCNKTNADVSFSSNYYFQFPKDDEIEV